MKLKQYEFNFQMVSGCSTLVQFQAVHEIRAWHYNHFTVALSSFKNCTSEVFSLQSVRWYLAIICRVNAFKWFISHDSIINLHINSVIRSQLRSPRGRVVKTVVAKSRSRKFESHREPKFNFSKFYLKLKILIKFNFK